jgi:hypothetical protein
LSRVPKIAQCDERDAMAERYWDFRNNKWNRNPATGFSKTQGSSHNMFSSAHSMRQTVSDKDGSTALPMTPRFPVLEINLSHDFETLGTFMLKVEGPEIGSAEVTGSSKLELQGLSLRKPESISATLTLFVWDDDTQSMIIQGVKHCEILFQKQPQKLQIVAGPDFTKHLNLQVKFYA